MIHRLENQYKIQMIQIQSDNLFEIDTYVEKYNNKYQAIELELAACSPSTGFIVGIIGPLAALLLIL